MSSKETKPTVFGIRLAELLKAHNNMPQGHFAEVLSQYMKANRPESDKKKHNYTQQHISNYITGKIQNPDVDVVIGIANFFSVSPLWMAGLSDDPNVEAAKAILTPEERGFLVELRSNPFFRAAVNSLSNLAAGSASPSASDEGENQARISGSSQTSQG